MDFVRNIYIVFWLFTVGILTKKLPGIIFLTDSVFIQGKICGHGKQISIRRHRLKLTMVAGNTRGKAELKTDVGNACFEFSASLNRKFFGR